MSKAFALDLSVHGIHSDTIAPTFIGTSMTRPFPADRASVLGGVKPGRLSRAEV